MTSPPQSEYSKVQSVLVPIFPPIFLTSNMFVRLPGIKAKVENTQQYEEYLAELKPLREELGINLKEDLYPDNSDSPYYNP